MTVTVSEHPFDSARLLFDLKLCGKLIRCFSNQLTVSTIAATVTDGLVEQFGCVFARLWITNADRTALHLVSSSGLHTHLDGSFASVPMGAFKVGKIAQHCIPFLSNCLAEESWVKDRDWVISNHIQGFAGLPLVLKEHALGVLAVFSTAPLSAEFLEVLQVLSIAVAGAISTAQTHQAILKRHQIEHNSGTPPTLSEQLGQVLGHQDMSLMGLEQPLPLTAHQLFLEAAQKFQAIEGRYCRLIYEPEQVSLEVIFPSGVEQLQDSEAQFMQLATQIEQVQGRFETRTDGRLTKSIIEFPLFVSSSELSEREHEVLELLAQGERDRNIAQQLYISERTVKFHVKNILAKLQVRTRVQAVFVATKKGWLV